MMSVGSFLNMMSLDFIVGQSSGVRQTYIKDIRMLHC